MTSPIEAPRNQGETTKSSHITLTSTKRFVREAFSGAIGYRTIADKAQAVNQAVINYASQLDLEVPTEFHEGHGLDSVIKYSFNPVNGRIVEESKHRNGLSYAYENSRAWGDQHKVTKLLDKLGQFDPNHRALRKKLKEITAGEEVGLLTLDQAKELTDEVVEEAAGSLDYDEIYEAGKNIRKIVGYYASQEGVSEEMEFWQDDEQYGEYDTVYYDPKDNSLSVSHATPSAFCNGPDHHSALVINKPKDWIKYKDKVLEQINQEAQGLK